MVELKPCPFCGGKAEILIFEGERVYIECKRHCCEQSIVYPNKELAIEKWNRRTTIETNIYDKEETYPNCTVQVLTNTATGEVSVGWWENGGSEDGTAKD